VRQLDAHPELAERLETFVSRFGRMQHTIADKLLPRWLQALAETPGSQIETLNRAERLGVLASTEQWLEARKLRNHWVHEYMDDANASAASPAPGAVGIGNRGRADFCGSPMYSKTRTTCAESVTTALGHPALRHRRSGPCSDPDHLYCAPFPPPQHSESNDERQRAH